MTSAAWLEEIMQIGIEEAITHCHCHLLPELVWIALCRIEEPTVLRVFQAHQIDRQQLRRRLRAVAAAKARILKPVTGVAVKIAQVCFQVFRQARERAATVGRPDPAPADILEELAECVDPDLDELFAEFGVSRRKLAATGGREFKQGAAGPDNVPPERGPTPFLDLLGKDYRALALQGRLGPVVGRRAEVLQVVQVLARKEKNNPVLVGEPGVGKTAIVEALALKALSLSAPLPLKDKRIVELSLTRLVAGTRHRGDVEERIQGVLREAAANPDVILFLDEIHMVVGAGNVGGAMDVANMLKPALARAEVCLIGATTPSEYRRYLESDPALERRFQPVSIEEPTREETLEILRALQAGYEAHHRVTFTPEALEAAVDLTTRHVPERRLPDKARDALDQAAAQVRIQSLTFRGGQPVPLIVGREAVATAVADWKGVPVENLNRQDRDHLQGLAERLRQRVMGQDEVVNAVSEAVQVALLGLSNPRKPHAAWLFAGPTGVGKTELARALAEQLFCSEEALLRFDMSEYVEPHSVARLLGAPPGYLGHDDGALLVDALRRQPFCVLLFDEIEKAHPQVHNLFLQILDDGRLTDAKGRTADFRNALIIFSSNLGAREAADARRGVFGLQSPPPSADRLREAVNDALREHFVPEFIGRLTGIHVFRPLDTPTMRAIVGKFLARLQDQLKSHRVRLDLTDAVYDYAIAQGCSRQLGARPLEQAVDQLLRVPIARMLLTRPPLEHELTLSVLKEGERLVMVWDDPLGTVRSEGASR